MKYEVTYACGHTGEVNLYGKGEERERKLEWLKTQLCPACEKAEREKRYDAEAKEAKEKADELGLPELQGSEKQVKWALTIRENMIEKVMSHVDTNQPEQQAFVDWMCSQNNARFWIDSRDCTMRHLVLTFREEAKEQEKEEKISEPDNTELAKPQDQETNVVAKISGDENEVKIVSDKDDNVIETARKMGYKWRDGAWRLTMTGRMGRPEDRIVEAGNRLLNAGVPIEIKKDLLQKAIDGDYKPHVRKWITSDGTSLCISWERDLDYYDEAKRLPGARWESGVGMKVKPNYFEEIREFAKLYDFAISEKAKNVLEKAEEKAKGIRTVKPQQKEDTDDKKADLKDIMKSSRDILDDLRDD